VKGRGRKVVAPSVQGGEDCPGDGWISVGAVEVSAELPEGTLPDRVCLGSGATSNVLGGLVGAVAVRALGRIPGLIWCILWLMPLKTGSAFDLEPVGGQGGRLGSAFLMVPVDHGCVASPEAVFLLPVHKGTGSRGDLEQGRGERRADLGLVEPDSPRFCLNQPGTLPRRGRTFELVTKSLAIAIHFAV
jgi:hypothetical protein